MTIHVGRVPARPPPDGGCRSAPSLPMERVDRDRSTHPAVDRRVPTKEQAMVDPARRGPARGAAGCAACEHCYCRNGVRHVRHHRYLLLSAIAVAVVTALSWGALQATWDGFDRRADTSVCRLIRTGC